VRASNWITLRRYQESMLACERGQAVADPASRQETCPNAGPSYDPIAGGFTCSSGGASEQLPRNGVPEDLASPGCWG
jgi:hypothetical protein